MALYISKTDIIWGVAALHGAWNFAQESSWRGS